MSSVPYEDENALDTQEIETQVEELAEDVEEMEMEVEDEGGVEDEDELEEEEHDAQAEVEPEAANKGKEKQKKEKKEVAPVVREPGKSLLPFSRVQKIIKADQEIPIVARDATFLISLAAEEFIKKFCVAGLHRAQGERRTTIQHRDMAAIVRRVDEFLFLEEIMPYTTTDPVEKKAGKTKAESEKSKPKPKTTLLDQFVGNKKVEDDDIMMNDDGTMYGVGTSNAEDDFE